MPGGPPQADPASPARQGSLPDVVKPVRLDGENDADLVPSPVPGVGSTGVALSERLDVLGAALRGDVDDPPRGTAAPRDPGMRGGPGPLRPPVRR